MSIAVIGTGYVGLVAAVCLASSGHQVLAVENNADKLALLRSGVVPIHEEGLSDRFEQVVGKGLLTFASDLSAALNSGYDLFLIAVGTPALPSGRVDLSQVEAVAEQIAAGAKRPLTVVMKSTVPPGTGKMLQERYLASADAPIRYAANPEFLREGQAVHDWFHPDRIVIGADDDETFRLVRRLYFDIDAPAVTMDLTSAEMVKYTSNAFLATKISFINEIANLCERIGADIDAVAAAVGMDERIGPRFLQAGVGYGGSCFPKDTMGLNYASMVHGYHSSILKAVIEVNERQRIAAVYKAVHALGTAAGKKVAVLGLAFKPGTDDIREAPAIGMIEQLLAMGAAVSAVDPLALANASRHPSLARVELTSDPYAACEGAHAVILATEWPQFMTLDWTLIREKMQQPYYLLDGRNCLHKQDLLRAGFRYEGVGR